jgi:Zn-dependent membrane protease YugP
MPFSVLLFLGLSGFVARMMIHAVTLPIEFDASFSKALPILREGNYISQPSEKAVNRILNAAALTYVSAALADILNLGRWLVILSRR